MRRPRKPTKQPGPVGLGQFGLTMPGIEFNTRYPDPTDALDASVSLGAKWVRFDLPWQTTENSVGVYDWSDFDPIVAACRSRGLNVCMILDYNNTLYCGGSNPKLGIAATDTANTTAFTNWVSAAVTHFKDDVRVWEVWNEPNTNFFWAPAHNVADYTALVKATYPVIKAADPNAFVLAGAMANTFSGSVPATFLAGIYSNGGQGYFDAVSHHPYSSPRGPGTEVDYSGWTIMSTAAEPNLRSIMVANGDTNKPIWATEVGAPTGGTNGNGEIVPEEHQARQVVDMVRLWQTYPWAGVLFIHTIRNPIDLIDTGHEHHFGLTYAGGVGSYPDSGRTDFEEKPGGAAFRNAVKLADPTGGATATTARNFTSTDKATAGSSMTFTSSLSFCTWFRQTTAASGANRFYDTGSENFRHNGSATPTFTFERRYTGTGAVNGQWTIGWLALSRPRMNEWNHVCVTHADGSAPKFYLNGRYFADMTVSIVPVGTVFTGAATVTIGNRGGGDRSVEGELNVTAFFNRVLTAAEVDQMASTAHATPTGQLGRYLFDASSPVPDENGTGPTLTLTGTTSVAGPYLF
jgi:hypothetical protein